MRTTEELFNAITSNGCREMELTRFTQALAEHDQEIIQMIDEIKEMLHSRIDIPVLEVQHILTELKERIKK